jgi:GntR family transcriptional regulator, transcriptional repressor for pyruvate dehydrogenase complex
MLSRRPRESTDVTKSAALQELGPQTASLGAVIREHAYLGSPKFSSLTAWAFHAILGSDLVRPLFHSATEPLEHLMRGCRDMNDSTRAFAFLELRRERLHEQIAHSIETMIGANQLRPGDQLPTERELAKLLGVNRATVREALFLLQQRGLVQAKAGSGSFIMAIPTQVVADTIQRYFAFGGCPHEDLVTVREIIEPEAAALAADKATVDDVAQLRDILERLEETLSRGDTQNNSAADTDFHVMLAKATHNELIVAITCGFHKPMRAWLEAQGQSQHPEGGARSHRSVYEAVAARDPVRARDAMRSHNRFTRLTLQGSSAIPVAKESV